LFITEQLVKNTHVQLLPLQIVSPPTAPKVVPCEASRRDFPEECRPNPNVGLGRHALSRACRGKDRH
jgi:hypothetical protein